MLEFLVNNIFVLFVGSYMYHSLLKQNECVRSQPSIKKKQPGSVFNFTCKYMAIIFGSINGSRVHRFILCQNYTVGFVTPPPVVRLCIAYFAVGEGWLLLDIG